METETTESQCIEYYVQIYESVRERLDSEQAASVVYQEVCKGIRMQAMHNERSGLNGSGATEKQLNFLKKLGVTPKSGLTKEEATAAIDSALANRDEDTPVYQKIPGRVI